MIPSKGNNQFQDNKFDFWIWSAPILQNQEEVVAKVEELKLTGRIIKDIRAVGYNYNFMWNDTFVEIFEAIKRGDDKALEKLDFPCDIVIDEPLLIQFEDGDILGIDYSEGSSIRMELNTLPWDINYGSNRRNFHANQMFKDILGRRLGDVLITNSMSEPTFTGSHDMDLPRKTSYLHSVSFLCMYDGQDINVPNMLKLNFMTEFDFGRVCLENGSSSLTLPARCIKDVLEGFLTADNLDYFLL